MTELQHEIAGLIAASTNLKWHECKSLATQIMKKVAQPEVYPEHKFAKRCHELWPGIRQGEITTLRFLLSKEICRHHELLFATDSKSEEIDIVKVWVSHLRRRTGAKIKNLYKIGYSMPLEDREKLKEEIGEI